MQIRPLDDRIAGFVLGAAIGDAIGLPREGISRRRARRVFGEQPLQHQLCFGRGMVSDDTEHLVMTALSLIDAQTNDARFLPALARRLRHWLACVPAGVGLATARSIIRLWLGWPPERSGVYSAGNGPAMRSGVLGLCLADDPQRLNRFVRESTRITHTDPKAEIGALAVAVAVRFGITQEADGTFIARLLAELRGLSDDGEWQVWLNHISDGLSARETAEAFAQRIGSNVGVRGYIYETVSVALFCWLRHPGDFRAAVEQAVRLGGDTDTVAAVVGGLAGITSGAAAIPPEWLSCLTDWPISVGRLRALSRDLARFVAHETVERNWNYPRFSALPRNLLFLTIVLCHGFRRLLPPY